MNTSLIGTCSSCRSLAAGLFPVLLLLVLRPAVAQQSNTRSEPSGGDAMIQEYFAEQTRQLQNGLQEYTTLEAWEKNRDRLRRELREMLGIEPLPERTPLNVTVTGTTEGEEFLVERLHFQSSPGLYVTGNLYRPRESAGRLPAILYVCGHAGVKEDGISLGNKVHYQHHGAWFARNGYICLTIDSLQLGEIEGIHHGTYRYDMWWWLNRGYTPAGVEAWNCIRALDYLQSRNDVDPDRLGVTGRSGGGAYSWWIAALDDRIRAAVPVAGITDLENHVIDGCVEGHCDCMYFVNTYRWDYPTVAALVAPRPLLISNTDRDPIFPLDGVVRTHEQVRRIYRLYGKEENLALQITAGPHQDTQELRVHAFRWFNQHLKSDDGLVRTVAEKFLKPADLRVFKSLPTDSRNAEIHESFVPIADMPTAESVAGEWEHWKTRCKEQLLTRTFAAWPREATPAEQALRLDTEQTAEFHEEKWKLRVYRLAAQPGIEVPLWILQRADLATPQRVILHVLDQEQWDDTVQMLSPHFSVPPASGGPGKASAEDVASERFQSTASMLAKNPWAMAYVAPRGIGPTRWNPDPKKQVQVRRRFYLLGQSLHGMQTYDVRRAIQALPERLPGTAVWLQAHGSLAGVALYASLFQSEVERLDLYDLPASHRDGPYLLNVRRTWDLPQAVALAADNAEVVLYHTDPEAWAFPVQVGQQLNWDARRIQFRQNRPPTEE